MPAVGVCWRLPPCWGELARRCQRAAGGSAEWGAGTREYKESVRHKGVSQPRGSLLGPLFVCPICPAAPHSLLVLSFCLPSATLFSPQPSTSSTPLPSWLLFSRLRQSEPVDTGVSQLSSFLFKTLVLKLLWSQMWEHT